MKAQAAVRYPGLLEAWRECWGKRGFRIELGASVGLLVVAGSLFSRFGRWLEARPGTVLSDPVLARLPAVDLTWVTFGVMYAAMMVALLGLLRFPTRLLFAFRVYAGVILARLVSIYLTELDDPATAIPLQDPIARLVFQAGQVPTKDLFFSGHTATMFTLYLTAVTPRLRALLLATTVVIGATVLLQHVHYAFDVFAAPFFAYGVHGLMGRLAGERLPGGTQDPASSSSHVERCRISSVAPSSSASNPPC